MKLRILLLGFLASSACADARFACSEDSQCTRGDADGLCEANGYCSFPDAECTSGRRYGDLAGGGFAGVCVQDDEGTGGPIAVTDSSGSSGTTGSPDPGPVSSTAAGESSGSGASPTSSGDPSASGGSDGESSGGGLPDSAECSQDDECQSGECYVAGPLGGLCGECNEDADCAEGGCSLPSLLSSPPQGSVCNAGELGGGCETSSACQAPLSCAAILDIPGLLTVRTCSECLDTVDCARGQVCNGALDIAQLGGQRTCVTPGSLADGEFCDIAGDGELACAAHCAEASLKGLAILGICGECRTNEDCLEGSCIEADITTEGTTTPSFCMG